jgi:hypothetical protein
MDPSAAAPAATKPLTNLRREEFCRMVFSVHSFPHRDKRIRVNREMGYAETRIESNSNPCAKVAPLEPLPPLDLRGGILSV